MCDDNLVGGLFTCDEERSAGNHVFCNKQA